MMTPDVWNPAQYERFRAERRQPFDDLLALVRPRPAMRLIDLGCGTGDLTRELHEKLPATSTVGVDRSPRMLARATPAPGLAFEVADIAHLSFKTPFDLVFSNAALQWVPDHPALLARLTGLVADHGQLAIQVPTFRHPIYEAAAAVAATEPFRRALGGWTLESPVLEPEEYARLLFDLGYGEQQVRLQVYAHVLTSREDVIEWVKGTLLTSYQERLQAERYEAFLTAYRERLFTMIADERPCLFTMSRILCWARR